MSKGRKLSCRVNPLEFVGKTVRIWNSEITSRLCDLEARGPWQPAPAAFDGSRGLYMGDRDLFAFMVDSGRRIFEKLPGGGLSRGFFVWNSEVGAASFGIQTFFYEYVCVSTKNSSTIGDKLDAINPKLT